MADRPDGGSAVALKNYHRGTHRVVDPSVTVERMRPLFPMYGITRVADITGLDRIGIPVVMVVRPNGRSLSVTQGKGATMANAVASGVMESVEAWHAERIERPLRLGCAADLRWSIPLGDVSLLPKSRQRQYTDEEQLLWIEGDELLSGTTRFVPYELVHTNYTLPLPAGSGMFLATSNGLASGNVPQEALAHALSEVIERDATTLWRRRSAAARARTRVDPETVDDPQCAELLAAFDRADVAVGVWNTTSDVGVAAFYVEIIDRHDQALNRLHAAAGMGCHPNRAIALLRALTEAAQSRLTLIAGSRDDIVGEDYRVARAPHLLKRQRELLVSWNSAEGRSFGAVPSMELPSIDDDVEHQIDRLRSVGVPEIVSVDLSRHGLPAAVVRVVVPLLEADSEMPGYVPGRRALAARTPAPS